MLKYMKNISCTDGIEASNDFHGGISEKILSF